MNLANGQKGFVLVATMVVLLLLVILGIAATTTSTIEMQIAGNEKAYKTAFYATDGGTSIGAKMVEENLGCPDGFSETAAGTGEAVIGDVLVASLDLARNTAGAFPPVAAPDLYFPAGNAIGSSGTTHISIAGNTELSSGNGLQMIAGYEGKGRASADGGGSIVYDITSQHLGRSNSQSIIVFQWRHIIGLEGECRY